VPILAAIAAFLTREEIIKWIAILVGVIAFIVFFAVAPLHALILSGLLVIFASLYFKVEPRLAKIAIWVGVGLIVVGTAALILPGLAQALRIYTSQLRKLLLGY